MADVTVYIDPTVARVQSRRWAEECYDAASDKPAFVQRVIQLGGTEPKPISPIVPMTGTEVKQFECEKIFFGVHKGKQVGDVPLSYLVRLTDPSEEIAEFLSKIRRYLRTPEVKSVLDQESNDDG